MLSTRRRRQNPRALDVAHGTPDTAAASASFSTMATMATLTLAASASAPRASASAASRDGAPPPRGASPASHGSRARVAAASPPNPPRLPGTARTRASVSTAAASTSVRSTLADELRGDFPILHQTLPDSGKPLVYLDSAASSQKPNVVIDAHAAYYREINANVHRGVHYLSGKATDAYELARVKVADFIGAETDREIVFTRNASEAINLVAYTWGVANLKPGDEVIISELEHHSNIVPWQLVCAQTGATLRHVGLAPDGNGIDMDALEAAAREGKTKLIATAHVSNVLGSEVDVPRLVKLAKSVGAKVLLDACQSVPHMPIDVKTLGVDWIVASGHKMCAPTGIGFLWGRADVLETMPPWMGGGEMIQDVFMDRSTYAPPPARFEAGTPAIGEAIALGAACDYLSAIGMDRVHEHEVDVGTRLYERLAAIDGVTVYGPTPAQGRASLAAFNVEGLHANDVCTLLDASGVATRSGHHCAQPLHKALNVPASARASLYLYNTREEVDAFARTLEETIAFFREINAGM